MKAKQRAFYANMEKLLNNWGEEEHETEHLKEWNLQTEAGKLHVAIRKNEDSRIYSIYTCFDNPKAANGLIPPQYATLNEYSGKCNFHHNDPEVCKWLFIQAIEPILEPKTEPCKQY